MEKKRGIMIIIPESCVPVEQVHTIEAMIKETFEITQVHHPSKPSSLKTITQTSSYSQLSESDKVRIIAEGVQTLAAINHSRISDIEVLEWIVDYNKWKNQVKPRSLQRKFVKAKALIDGDNSICPDLKMKILMMNGEKETDDQVKRFETKGLQIILNDDATIESVQLQSGEILCKTGGTSNWDLIMGDVETRKPTTSYGILGWALIELSEALEKRPDSLADVAREIGHPYPRVYYFYKNYRQATQLHPTILARLKCT